MPTPATSVEETGDLINNENKISEDLRKIKGYVKDDLFVRVIDVYNNNEFEIGSFLYRDFLKKCKPLVTDLGPEEEYNAKWSGYMKYLWSQLGIHKSYRAWLSVKRSNAYQAVQDRFKGK